MSVIQRPLFRAAGGGANKFPDLSGDGKVTQKDILMGRGVIEKQEGGGIGAMMPEQMPAEAPLDPLAQDVLMAREEGEKIGLDYLAETMDGIDMAASTEELINSIRGNDRPLQDRVAELATFVGEQDAVQTPESVLAMVQPTIMLTEEGAIDSGVGGLIQDVIGETDMGAEMGQGVGALMAQGQPEPVEQPLQQFNQGGAVKKLAFGGDPVFDPTLGTSFSPQSIRTGIADATGGIQPVPDLASMLPPEYAALLQSEALQRRDPRSARDAAAEYQTLMEEAYDMEGQRAFSDREAALDLARAGFAFASGRDPKTGENMAGRGFLAQLGSVGQQYAESAGERLARERKGEQGIRLAAIQQGIAAEQRDQEAQERSTADARRAIMEGGLEKRRLDQQGLITVAGLKSAGENLVAEIGFNAFESDANRKFQAQQTDRKAELEENITRVRADLTEAQAERDFGRLQTQTETLRKNQLELTGVNFNNDLAIQTDRFTRQQDLINLQGGIDQALQTQRLDHTTLLQNIQQDFLAGQSELDRDLQRDLSDDELDYRREALELNQEKFAQDKALAPSTEDSFLYDVSGGFVGQGSQARELNEINADIQRLRASALAQGIDQNFLARTDQNISNYISLADLALRQERMAFAKSESVLGALQAQGAGPKFGTAPQQTELLGNRTAINAYAKGLDVPGFDLALNNMFGTVTLDNRGNQVPARKLTPALRAALIRRKEAGFAVPALPGFANGGEVDMGAGQGLLDPVTGFRFPMTQETLDPEQLPRTYEPTITQDIADITKATGTQEGLLNIGGVALNTVANAIFGTEAGLAADTRQAKKAVETLGTVATTTLMAAIPGKDNVELQRMLKNMQVPADSFSLQDDEALDYFKLARNTMDLGIKNQEDLLDNANLTRKEITKVQTDLAQMNAIQAEYDNVIKAYEAKLMPSEEVYDSLDKFFK
tara:strand:- start:2620 stop:5466 length:2847 start_codon:yes stop_codon:yes gene_type:complete